MKERKIKCKYNRYCKFDNIVCSRSFQCVASSMDGKYSPQSYAQHMTKTDTLVKPRGKSSNCKTTLTSFF